MINDTLDLSRIESGHIELTPTALDVGDLVAASVALLADSAEKRGVRVDAQLSAGADAAETLPEAIPVSEMPEIPVATDPAE